MKKLILALALATLGFSAAPAMAADDGYAWAAVPIAATGKTVAAPLYFSSKDQCAEYVAGASGKKNTDLACSRDCTMGADGLTCAEKATKPVVTQ